MVSDADVKRRACERADLVFNEVGPGATMIVPTSEYLAIPCSSGFHILIDFVNRAKISQVPIETGGIASAVSSNRRHYDIAAVAGVARDDEAPGSGSGRSVDCGNSSADLCGCRICEDISIPANNTHDREVGDQQDESYFLVARQHGQLTYYGQNRSASKK